MDDSDFVTVAGRLLLDARRDTRTSIGACTIYRIDQPDDITFLAELATG
jgi:hypothetical protein